MASGNTLFILEPFEGRAPATLAAEVLPAISDASTPAAQTPVLVFDPSTAWHMDFHVTMPSQYGGGGYTFSFKGGTDNTDVGTFIVALRSVVVADADILTGDLGVDAATAVTVTDTPPATPINKLNYSTTGTLSHVNAGSPSGGDRMILRLSRDISDTNTGNLQLAEALIVET